MAAAAAELAEFRRNEPGARPLCGAIIGARSPFGERFGKSRRPRAARKRGAGEGGGGGDNTGLLSSLVSVDRPPREAAPPLLFPGRKPRAFGSYMKYGRGMERGRERISLGEHCPVRRAVGTRAGNNGSDLGSIVL